jgi:hypothetical protein
VKGEARRTVRRAVGKERTTAEGRTEDDARQTERAEEKAKDVCRH